MATALEKIAQIAGKKEFLLGGNSGALQTDFPTCVTKVYGQEKAAMVIEADFVAATADGVRREGRRGGQVLPVPEGR